MVRSAATPRVSNHLVCGMQGMTCGLSNVMASGACDKAIQSFHFAFWIASRKPVIRRAFG